MDVIIIQNLLNNSIVKFPGKLSLKSDGKCGPATIKQIELFQKHVVLMPIPDSKIDPGGKTISQLKSKINRTYLLGQQLTTSLNLKSNVSINRYINLYRSQYPKAKNINYLERLAKATQIPM